MSIWSKDINLTIGWNYKWISAIYYYTDDMIYETGNMGNWFPEIAEFSDETKFQYVIVDKKGNYLNDIIYEIIS